MYAHRSGSGRPILLVHGLGSTWESWDPILPGLRARREVIAVDLPGFGRTPPLPGEVSIASLTDEVESFIAEEGLDGVDLLGSSMGARMVLELARRGATGTTVALDPGGFWGDGGARYLDISLRASIRLVRALQPVLPALLGNPVGRTALLAQLSARPWALSREVALRELRSFAAAPSFDAALHALTHGPRQRGSTSNPGAVVIGWGRQDRVTLPGQAAQAIREFPKARLHWFDGCGHFPHWDKPQETVDLVLASTAQH